MGRYMGGKSRLSPPSCRTYLDELVPAGGDNDGVLGVGREADARNPLGVALVGDGVLAVAQGVPQLDGAVARAGDDLAVVGREGDGEDVVGVADEATGGGAGGELPKSQGLVPRSGQSVGTVGGDDLPFQSALLSNNSPPLASMFYPHSFSSVGTYAVRDDVGVAVEGLLGVTVLRLVTGQVPDDQGLVTGAGQEHVGAIA